MIGELRASLGQPIKIAGYAQDFEAPIAAVQFSCDEGKTWTTYLTNDTDPDCNVNWSFSFTPPQTGIYRLLVRALGSDGRVSPKPASVIVDVGAEEL